MVEGSQCPYIPTDRALLVFPFLLSHETPLKPRSARPNCGYSHRPPGPAVVHAGAAAITPAADTAAAVRHPCSSGQLSSLANPRNVSKTGKVRPSDFRRCDSRSAPLHSTPHCFALFCLAWLFFSSPLSPFQWAFPQLQLQAFETLRCGGKWVCTTRGGGGYWLAGPTSLGSVGSSYSE